MKTDYRDLGRRVRKRRKDKGWSQDRLAEQVGISFSFVGHIERGTRNASLDTLVALANTLNCSLDYLLAASLRSGVESALPNGVSAGQLKTMQEILRVLQDNLEDWGKQEGLLTEDGEAADS